MPRPLFFKKAFHAAIRQGRKTTTLRRWSACRLRPGERVVAPGVGRLLIEAADAVRWETLTDADANADGFESVAELELAVRKIYPNLDHDGKTWYRLRFTLEPGTQPEPAEPPRKKRRNDAVRGGATSRSRAQARLAAVVRAELDRVVLELPFGADAERGSPTLPFD